jgi:hypothetical protein
MHGRGSMRLAMARTCEDDGMDGCVGWMGGGRAGVLVAA